MTKYLDKSLEVIALTCLIISVLGAISGVFFRYVMGFSVQILEEICRYSIIYGVFAYIGPLIKRDDHLKMDILNDLLTGKAKLINRLLISILLLASFVFLCYSSIIWTTSLLKMNILTESGTMILFIPTLSIPIGMFLGCVYSLLQVISDFYNLRYNNSVALNKKEESKMNNEVREL